MSKSVKLSYFYCHIFMGKILPTIKAKIMVTLLMDSSLDLKTGGAFKMETADVTKVQGLKNGFYETLCTFCNYPSITKAFHYCSFRRTCCPWAPWRRVTGCESTMTNTPILRRHAGTKSTLKSQATM